MNIKTIVLQYFNDQRTASNRARAYEYLQSIIAIQTGLQPISDSLADLLALPAQVALLDQATLTVLQGLSDNLDDILAVGTVEFQASATHIQWRINEGDWVNIIAIADITGAVGADGADGANGANGADGADGQEIELQTNATHLQWRYVGGAWADLILLADITGDDGAAGAAGANGADGADGDQVIAVVEKTASFNLSDADAGKYIEGNHATVDITITVPNTLTAKNVWTFEQTGAANIIFAAGAGSTINTMDGLQTVNQYHAVSLICKSTGVYTLIGGQTP